MNKEELVKLLAEIEADKVKAAAPNNGDDAESLANSIAEKMTGAIENGIAKALEKVGQPSGGKPADVVTPEAFDEKALAALSKEEKIIRFFSALRKRDDATLKALAEGTDDQGGYLVPTEFRAEVVRAQKDLPVVRRFAFVIPMDNDSLDIPKLAADVQVYWGSENTSITTTSADFGTLNLTPYRLNAILYTSRELVADNKVGLVGLITQLFAEAVSAAEDAAFVNGSGSGQPTGILQASINSVDASNAMTADHIISTYWRLPQAYRQRAVWIMNSRVVSNIDSFKDNNGQYLLKSAIDDGALPTLKGRPVLEQNAMPSSKIIFGDLRYYYIGDREQMSVETTTEGAGTFEKHQLAIKVTERVDGETALTSAFRLITNTGVS